MPKAFFDTLISEMGGCITDGLDQKYHSFPGNVRVVFVDFDYIYREIKGKNHSKKT